MERPASLERFGVYRLLRSIYDEYVRDRLPRKVGVYNGIPIRDRALFDVTDEQPEYEGALVSGIRRQVSTGDHVVVVGGGRGVSTVCASTATGPDGRVECFEGGLEQYNRLADTIRLNRVDRWTSAHHAVVGEAVDIYGESDGASVVAPADLPDCDVLVLDCEGAEIGILTSLERPPETVIVETHGFLDSPESAVREVLAERGYEVIDRGVEYEDRGVIVLTARRT